MTLLQISAFVLLIVSVIVVIFFSVRRFLEWAIGFFLVLVFLFYYSESMIAFLISLGFSKDWLVSILASYRGFILSLLSYLDGLPYLGHVNPSFAPTWWPFILLYLGGLVRLVVIRFVPNERVKQATHEYWLALTSFVIFLLAVSTVMQWNFIITLLVFIIVLLIVAAGLHRLFMYPFIIILMLLTHVYKWLRLGTKHLAYAAVKVTKFLKHLRDYLIRLQDKYIAKPIYWLDEKLNQHEEKQEARITDKLRNEK